MKTECKADKPSLSPGRASELRSILSDRSLASDFVKFFALKASPSEPTKDPVKIASRKLIGDVFTRQYENSVRLIFEYVESPIELVFLNSLMCSCLKNGVLVIVQPPPPGDFREATGKKATYYEGLFKCYSFYNALPLECRPKTFLRFLEIQAVERGELSQEEASSMAGEACVMYDLGFVHALHICLQPTFERFNGSRSVRPDAAIWIPSDRSFRMIVECDGFETHGQKDAFCNDRQRDRAFQALGYSVRRYSGSEIYNQPIQASTDLAEYLIDQDKASLSGKEWEGRLKRSQSSKPSAPVINGWRERMEDERRAK